MIDWEKRRAEYKAGKFRRRIVKAEPIDLHLDRVTLECGHESTAYHDVTKYGEMNCDQCIKAEYGEG